MSNTLLMLIFEKYLTPETRYRKQLYYRETWQLKKQTEAAPGYEEQRGDPRYDAFFFYNRFGGGWMIKFSWCVRRQMRCLILRTQKYKSKWNILCFFFLSMVRFIHNKPLKTNKDRSAENFSILPVHIAYRETSSLAQNLANRNIVGILQATSFHFYVLTGRHLLHAGYKTERRKNNNKLEKELIRTMFSKMMKALNKEK